MLDEKIWQEYSRLYSKFTPSFQYELLEKASNFSYGNVLDMGTGVGKLLPFLDKNPKVKSITAIDSSKNMLEIAKKKAIKLSKVKKLVLEDITFYEEGCDTICSLNVIYSLNNPIEYLKKCYRMLNDDGQIIISSQKRDLNFTKLANICNMEFENDSDYERYKELNYYLTKKSSHIKAYELDEIESILKLIGFKTIEKDEKQFLGNSFFIVSNK